MSPDAELAPPAGTELAAVLSARRTTIVTMASVLALGALILLVAEFDRFPREQVAMTLPVFPVALMAWAKRRSDEGIRWALGAIMLQALSTAFSNPQTNARLSGSILLFMAVAFGAISLRRRARVVWLLIVITSWIVIVPATALTVEVSGHALNARWATLGELVVTAIWVSIAWDTEIRRVRLRDDLTARRRAEAVETLAFRERLRIWRESLVRIHETVLNDIRSALDSEHLDWARLGSQLAGRRAIAPPVTQPTDLRGIAAAVANAEDLHSHLTVGTLPNITFSPERAEALRSVLLELARNLMRHSGATRLSIAGNRVGEAVLLHIVHDGRDEARTREVGIGLGIVLADALTVLHAALETRAHLTELRLAVEPQESDAELLLDANTWRTVLSSGAAGLAVGGLPYYMLIAMTAGSVGLLMAIAATLTALIPMYASWRRRSLPGWLVLLGACTATAVPLLASRLPADCSRFGLGVIVSTLSVLAVSAIVMWAPSPGWWLLALGSAAAMSGLAVGSGLQCRPSGQSSFLAALLAPILLGVVYSSLRASTARENQARALEHRAMLEAVSAEASHSVGTELHAAVRQATALLERCAQRQAIDEAERVRLRCLDAEIRATIQVNPETAGGFAMASRALVQGACERDVPLRVLTLRDSGDPRPMPDEVATALRALIDASTQGEATIRVLTSPGEDRLIVTTSSRAARESGLAPHWQCTFEDGSADFEVSDGDAPAILMVQRSSRG